MDIATPSFSLPQGRSSLEAPPDLDRPPRSPRRRALALVFPLYALLGAGLFAFSFHRPEAPQIQRSVAVALEDFEAAPPPPPGPSTPGPIPSSASETTPLSTPEFPSSTKAPALPSPLPGTGNPELKTGGPSGGQAGGVLGGQSGGQIGGKVGGLIPPRFAVRPRRSSRQS